MKSKILSVQGDAMKDIELPRCFSASVREDLILKAYESAKMKQPYAPFLMAGMHHSASGIVKHARRKWKTAYGYGISRVPRKIFSRSGTRFTWTGAEIASTRGGRESHPPKVINMQNERKINKKELRKTLQAAFSASASYEWMKKNFPNLKKLSLPLVFESKISELNTKDMQKLLVKVVDGRYADRVLILTGQKEKLKCRKFETATPRTVSIMQLASGGRPGRIIAFTEKAIEELKTL